MNTIILILVGALGAISTFYVSEQLKQGAVRASAALSLFVGSFFYFFPELFNSYLSQHIPLVFIGASFVGMVSKQVLSNYILLGIAGCLFGFIYTNSSDFFQGFGGGLGTSAFIALVATFGVFKIVSILYKRVGYEQ